VPRSVIAPPSPEAIQALLAEAEVSDPQMACWLHVAVATGARRGEICALRWCDIDQVAKTVRIERSVSVTKSGGVFVKSTKTDRARLVSLTTQAIEALAETSEPNGLSRSDQRTAGA